MRNKWQIVVDRDVADILKDEGVDVDGGAIESIIWSHHHWDHVGDASTFPHSTEIIVGPGFKDAHLPGYPKNKESPLLEKDFEGREVRELSFDKSAKGLKIGRFNALDYFGDGSFYLLDTPGHSIGHICALARTSVKPESFVFMVGDGESSLCPDAITCHTYQPFQRLIMAASSDQRNTCPCPRTCPRRR